MNEHQKLSDIPMPIRGFYVESSEGVATLKQRTECKTVSDLERVIALDKPQNVIMRFAKIIADYAPWLFFDNYQYWLVECEKVNAFNSNLPVIGVNEQGANVLAEPKSLPDEPVKPQPITANEVLAPYVVSLFKSDRSEKMRRAKITISSGKKFDADEQSITRLNNAINAARNENADFIIQWSTADVGTGEMIDCTKSELEEAHTKAVKNMAVIWKI